MEPQETASAVAPATSVARLFEEAGGISEITILPDGRLYVLGLSTRVLQVVNAAGPWDRRGSAGNRSVRAEPGEQQKESSR